MEECLEELRAWQAAAIRPGLDKACSLSEAHRGRLYAEMYAFFEKEAEAAHTRRIHLIMLIARESSVDLGGGLHQLIGEARRYFCTERRRQLDRPGFGGRRPPDE